MFKEQAIAVAKEARKNPAYVEELRNDPRQKQLYQYVCAVLMNDEIKDLCRTNGITDYKVLMQLLEVEHPRLYEHLCIHGDSAATIMIYLENLKATQEKHGS